jgi:hypothetical protein
MDMQIIIPTRGRTNQQLTLQSFNSELRRHTTLVCPKKEVFKLGGLSDDIRVVAQPDPDWTIAQKRKWIIQEWFIQKIDKIIMLDDDLRFATRISETDWKLKEIRGEELCQEFERLSGKLGEFYPHVGFGPRQGNNTLEEVGWKTPGRMCYSLGYFLPVVMAECELGRIETREDMDMTLQLLRKGYPNAVWQTTVNDQRKFDAPGGATLERTIERSNEDARKLARLHAGYVSVTEKKYKSSGEGGAYSSRLEVIVQWKKAFEDGVSKRAMSE